MNECKKKRGGEGVRKKVSWGEWNKRWENNRGKHPILGSNTELQHFKRQLKIIHLISSKYNTRWERTTLRDYLLAQKSSPCALGHLKLGMHALLDSAVVLFVGQLVP